MHKSLAIITGTGVRDIREWTPSATEALCLTKHTLDVLSVRREPFPSRFVFLPMMDTFTLLSFVVTFLAGATAGAWLNALTNSYGVRAPGRSSIANS
jgi:hypothetical protein